MKGLRKKWYFSQTTSCQYKSYQRRERPLEGYCRYYVEIIIGKETEVLRGNTTYTNPCLESGKKYTWYIGRVPYLLLNSFCAFNNSKIIAFCKNKYSILKTM